MTFKEASPARTEEPNLEVAAESANTTKPRKRKSLAERHSRQTDKSAGLFGCWEWTHNKSTDGYGKIGVNGDTVPAHRVAWEIANGMPVPNGKLIRHTCHNPLCQNPAHMLLGTKADNSSDMIAAGRQSKGPTPAATVLKIVDLAIDGMKAPAIAAKVGVSVVVVRDILRGKSHTKITEIPRNRASTKGRDLAAIMPFEEITVLPTYWHSTATAMGATA